MITMIILDLQGLGSRDIKLPVIESNWIKRRHLIQPCPDYEVDSMQLFRFHIARQNIRVRAYHITKTSIACSIHKQNCRLSCPKVATARELRPIGSALFAEWITDILSIPQSFMAQIPRFIISNCKFMRV